MERRDRAEDDRRQIIEGVGILRFARVDIELQNLPIHWSADNRAVDIGLGHLDLCLGNGDRRQRRLRAVVDLVVVILAHGAAIGQAVIEIELCLRIFILYDT